MGEEKKPTVFYVVKGVGDKREDIARSATKEDAEKHMEEVHATLGEGESAELVVEERAGAY